MLSPAVVCSWLATLLSTTPVAPAAGPSQGPAWQVRADITGRGHAPGQRSGPAGFFVTLTVTNPTPLAQELWTMSCSWQDQWRTDRAGTFLWGVNCDKNVPVKRVLGPQETQTFAGFVVVGTPNGQVLPQLGASAVRLGFRAGDAAHVGQDSQGPTWWSNPVRFVAEQ